MLGLYQLPSAGSGTGQSSSSGSDEPRARDCQSRESAGLRLGRDSSGGRRAWVPRCPCTRGTCTDTATAALQTGSGSA